LEAIITSHAFGKWTVMPSEPMLSISTKVWESFRAIAPSGELNYENRKVPLEDLHFFHIRMKSPDLLRFNLVSSSSTLLFNLVGSCIVEIRPGQTRAFHERSCNLINRANNEFSLRFREKMTSLLLLICLSKEFALTLEEEIAIPRNESSALLTAKNYIIIPDMLDLLSEILFHDCSPEGEDFIVEEVVRALLLWMIDKKERGPFQPLSTYKADEGWFREMKNRLLEVKNKPQSFQRLMQAAGIIEVKRFRKLLRSFYGLSIQEFLTEARMCEAQTMLLKMDRPIKQIAAETGYKNIYHFTKVFKAYTGMPPAIFRK
jgi:AraC-like DNA-binding protein